jgi:hypothetical protein
MRSWLPRLVAGRSFLWVIEHIFDFLSLDGIELRKREPAFEPPP